jgi:hypothetical protein
MPFGELMAFNVTSAVERKRIKTYIAAPQTAFV